MAMPAAIIWWFIQYWSSATLGDGMDSKYPQALVINYNVSVKASTILRL